MIDSYEETSVTFETDDDFLKRLFDEAEEKMTRNIKLFGNMQVLVEGCGYDNVWIETQPMAGEMYAKRNLKLALNNQLIFMQNQREDGRLPGMISIDNGKLTSHYAWFQGYCFPTPAYKIFYLIGKDKAYLKDLYKVLEGHDNYLWRNRDSNNDGCLETWCVFDTGEDNCSRLDGAPNSWEGELPPVGTGKVPYASMDIMGYSYEGRNILAKVSKELNNGKENYWTAKAEEVRGKIKSYLWIPDKHACYDRDNTNTFMDVLIHNNLRVMYFGAFTQEMADEFIQYHLLNPDEFWTEMPLPSIAVNDPLFRNSSGNNWSGQPEGLTYQRAIRALENYGHYAEITLLGHKLIKYVGESCCFPQQFDPFTGQPGQGDEYGPTILSVLEYISRMYGIHIDEETIFWSGLGDNEYFTIYIQKWQGSTYKIKNSNGYFKGYINEKEIFSASNGVRIITDLKGKILFIIGIDTISRKIQLNFISNSYNIDINPNETYCIDDHDNIVLFKKVPFQK